MNNQPSQLSLFGDTPVGDDRPLPLLIAEQFGFAIQTHEVEGKTYFAVQDWIAGVSRSDRARKFWTDIKRRNPQLSAACGQFSYTAENGKSYQMDYADSVTLYEITMRMGAETGIRNRVLRYLANSGEAIDQIRRNPAVALEIGIRLTSPKTAVERAKQAWLREGKTEAWIKQRLDGMVTRRSLTDTLKQVVEGISGREYGLATGTIYQRLYDLTAHEIRVALGLPPSANIRDHITELGLKYLGAVELVVEERLSTAEHVMWEEALQIIREVSGMVGRGLRELEAYRGRSAATGQSLIQR